MAKKVKAIVKLQINAGGATPAPPVGTVLGPHGIPLQDFCKQFNDATKDRSGVVPAVITIYEDRSFSFILKVSPVPDMLKKAANIQKGSAKPLQDKIGSVTRAQIEEIARTKMPDLNTTDIASAMRMVEGTARQMGLTIQE